MKQTSQSIKIRVGEEFEVRLRSNPTTGYSWTLRRRPDEAVAEITGPAFIAPGGDKVGAPGEELWKIRAAGKGKTSIVLQYHRSFEPDKSPAERKTFKVVVE
jgi:inhibitor of cysteine peptidase